LMTLRYPAVVTVTFDMHISQYAYDNPSYNWQVIFRTHDGLDYCRETRPGSWSKDVIRTWAHAEIATHCDNVATAEIQRW
jgi:hypothetical protein